MRKPFASLTGLRLCGDYRGGETAPVDPDLFLGGSAPSQRVLQLQQMIPSLGLPKLLLSSSHLTDLLLFVSGYVSPEAMMTNISALTRLKTLSLEFDGPRSSPDLTSPPPPARTLLLALISLNFKGESGYLEHLLAGIDAPLLDNLYITFFPQLSFHTPQLTEFINRTPRLKLHDDAAITFYKWTVLVTLPRFLDGGFRLQILCDTANWHFSSKVQICTSSISQAIGPIVKRLYILDDRRGRANRDNFENGQWLDLLRPFGHVKELYLCREFTYYLAPALQELVGERAREVLPGLQKLFLELGLSQIVQDVIGQFIAARQLSGHPIAVSPQWH